MKLIGIDLYQHLLGQALREARGEVAEDWTPELHLGAQGELPEAWIPDVDIRLTLYVRLSRVAEEAELDAFEDELVDRFGPLPDAAVDLMANARVGLAARTACVARVDAGPSAIALTPRRDFVGDPGRHGLVVKNDRLLLVEALNDGTRVERVRTLLEALEA